MSEVTPIPKPAHYEFVANGFIDHIFDWYSLAQLQAYGAAEYQRALDDAATELEGLRDQTGCSVSDLIRNLK
jgi:hypothetical protein